jgi:hypothetical protein
MWLIPCRPSLGATLCLHIQVVAPIRVAPSCPMLGMHRAKALERAQAALQESGAETSLHLARTDELMRRVESQMAGEQSRQGSQAGDGQTEPLTGGVKAYQRGCESMTRSASMLCDAMYRPEQSYWLSLFVMEVAADLKVSSCGCFLQA